MLNLIQTEFIKLRRRKSIYFMLLTALIMPFFALVYFSYLGDTGVNPLEFYRWSAFGYSIMIILPIILGIFSTILMNEENKNDTLKQLWITPVNKMEYFFSKFFMVLVYAITFMLITFIASLSFGVLSGYVVFDLANTVYLFQKCLEISIIISLAILPILAIAVSQKGYILPICITLVYTFSAFFLMGVNTYLHPITSMLVIIMRNNDIPGIIWPQGINVPLAALCIFAWNAISILFASNILKRRG